MPAGRAGPSVKNATQSKYYPWNGGLDVVTPALSVDPGFLLACVNFEPFYNGGYRRIDGYERYDGHAKPSAAVSYGAQISSFVGLTVGTSTGTATGVSCQGSLSNATAQFVWGLQVNGTGWIALTNVSGTFTAGDQIIVGTATSTGTLLAAPSVSYGPSGTGTDGYLYTNEMLIAAQNYYRQQINPVPGTGNLLGAWQLNGTSFAIRGTATVVGGTATALPARLYVQSGTGWTTSGVSYAYTQYYQGAAQQDTAFTASIDVNGVLYVTATSGTLYTGQTISDSAGLVPIGATITSQISGAVGGVGDYQLSVAPSVAVASESMTATNPVASLPTAGQVVVGATSSATGTVAYAVPQDTTVGYMAYSSVTGTFGTAEALQVIVGGTATVWGTAAAATTQFALPTTGFYRFRNVNFFASSSTYNAYGVNGAGPAFQIDQNNLVTPILMPQTAVANQPSSNTPFLIEDYQNFLFLAFPGGVYFQSVAGQPLQLNGFLGAAEFGVGSEITGLFSIVGPNLVITTQHNTQALSGNSDANFVQSLVAERAGAVKNSGVLLDTVYAINNLGITSLSRTQSYGNFVGATISQLIQPLIAALRPNFTDATIVESSNQGRFYFNDGSCLIMYVPGLGQQNKAWSAIETGVTAQFGYANYPEAIYCAYNSQDASNNEVRFFGFNNGDGYVYQDGAPATSFDGNAITAYARLAFNNVGSPALRKYFRRLDLEINSAAQVFLQFAADFSYSTESQSSAVQALTASDIPVIQVFGGGGYWDSVNWNAFDWDGQTISTCRAQINGTGQNVSFLVFHQAVADEPFILQGCTIYFDPRRLQR